MCKSGSRFAVETYDEAINTISTFDEHCIGFYEDIEQYVQENIHIPDLLIPYVDYDALFCYELEDDVGHISSYELNRIEGVRHQSDFLFIHIY